MPQWAQSDAAQFELNITGMLNATTTIRMNVNRTDTAANMSLSEEIQTNESKTSMYIVYSNPSVSAFESHERGTTVYHLWCYFLASGACWRV